MPKRVVRDRAPARRPRRPARTAAKAAPPASTPPPPTVAEAISKLTPEELERRQRRLRRKNPALLLGDGLCGKLPTCSRAGCGHAACDHGSSEPHAMSGCAGYQYPANWICQNCSRPSTEHGVDWPHTDDAFNCDGFIHVPGQTSATFIGGGGRFGGGGASGSW